MSPPSATSDPDIYVNVIPSTVDRLLTAREGPILYTHTRRHYSLPEKTKGTTAETSYRQHRTIDELENSNIASRSSRQPRNRQLQMRYQTKSEHRAE
ncbi:hypothetical protein Tco_1007154 [Tanacetum coccineum]